MGPGMGNRRGRTLVRLAGEPFSYPEVGATGAALPTGYRHVHRRVHLGRGAGVFWLASEALTSWQMHRSAGLVVTSSGPASQAGVVVVLTLGCAPIGLRACCRIVYVVDEPDRHGFAYGTLRRHPETGEESFLVVRTPDDVVWFHIDAFSRPASVLARVAGPLSARVQQRITDRYVAALRAAVARAPLPPEAP